MSEKVVIVGAGVSGLTSAVVLAEDPYRRFDVRVVAERIGVASLSGVAAASFFPYAASHPCAGAWMRTGMAAFLRLAESPETGVVLRPGHLVSSRPIDVDPWWRDLVLDGERGIAGARGLDRRYVDGVRFRTPIIEMPIYLEYLRRRLERAGGVIEPARIASLDDVVAADTTVVQCGGVRARELADDPRVTPSLGQLVRVTADEEIGELRIDEDDATRPTYVVPRSRDRVLGTIDRDWPAERGLEPPDPDSDVTRAIVDRAAALDPTVRSAVVLDSYCGLRPRRDVVRVEVDATWLARGLRVVHNYGHGGAGVTLSWGAASDARDLVASLLAVPARGRVGG